MGQRLLLVDSDRGFLKEHRVSLESAFDLEVASSPEGVLQRLEGGGYAAVLISVEVAENKGYALCSAIRKQATLADLKVALISAKATEEEYRRHQTLKGRADLYLRKPMAPSALVTALAPLVPGRTLDPDNPFGELMDSEAGDDWLDGLKGTLDEPAPLPAAAPRAPAVPVPAPVAEVLRQTAPVGGDSARLQQLEGDLALLRTHLDERDRQLLEAREELQDLRRQAQSASTLNLDELDRRDREIQALRARLADAEASLLAADPAGKEAALAQLNASLEGLAERHSSLEDLHQSALLEVAGFKEKAHVLQLEVAGLEATMRGQARDLAELGQRMQGLEGEVAAGQALLRARDEQAEASQAEVARLTDQLASLRQQLDEAAVQHEGERLELMHGLDTKEADLARLKETHAALEREKQGLHGQLAEHQDRLRSLDALLADLMERARRGSDLARG